MLSAGLSALGIYWIARAFVVDGQVRFGNPVGDMLVEIPGSLTAPLQIKAEVTVVKGETGVSLGDKCEFLVEQRARGEGTLYCNAQVTCAGRLVYGGPDRGYFACRFFETPRRGVMGSDPSTTSADQDGAIHLDTRSGVLRIWDDVRGPHGAFTIEADVLACQ